MIHRSASSSTSSVDSHRGVGRRIGPERADSVRVMRSELEPVDAQTTRRPSHFRLNPRATTTSWTGPSGRTLDGCCPFLRGNDKPDFFPGHSAAGPLSLRYQPDTKEVGSDFPSIIGGFLLRHQVLCRAACVGFSCMYWIPLDLLPTVGSHGKPPKLFSSRDRANDDDPRRAACSSPAGATP